MTAERLGTSLSARGTCDDVIKRERSVVSATLNAGGAYIAEAAGSGEKLTYLFNSFWLCA